MAENKGKILVVDDNPKNIQIMANILNDNDYEVEIALNGKEALNWLNKEDFDLLLLDIMMPEINGYEVCKTLRKDSKFDLLPIVFLSAKTDKESIVHGLNIGGQDYMVKPFDTSELLARVATHVMLKKDKEEVIRKNEKLEEIIEERTKLLAETNKQLLNITNTKDSFISFIAKEVSIPINKFSSTISRIKSLAESQRFVETIMDLEDSKDRIALISDMANQITQINNGSEMNNTEIRLDSLLELILIQIEMLLINKNITIKTEFEGVTIIGNRDTIKNSIDGTLKDLIEKTNENGNLKIKTGVKDKNIELTIEGETNNGITDNNLHDNSSLFFSFSEMIMSLHNGKYTVHLDPESGLITTKWIFPLQKIE